MSVFFFKSFNLKEVLKRLRHRRIYTAYGQSDFSDMRDSMKFKLKLEKERKNFLHHTATYILN